MKLGYLTKAIATTTTIGLLSLTATAAHAGTFHNGWNYAIDSFNDGYNAGTIGANSKYEMYGIAIQETAETVSVAINSNAPLGGWYSGGATNNNIAFGDLFFNFGAGNLASSQGNLFAVHFDSNGDNGLDLGVYSNVEGKKVGGSNNGFTSLQKNANDVSNQGGTANLADLAQNDPYFNNEPINAIKSGTKIGDIALLEANQLAGLDFGHFSATGNYTFGFSFDRSLLPSGDFLAHLFFECANDGMAIEGSFEEPPVSTPEPNSMLALALLGGTFALKRRFS